MLSSVKFLVLADSKVIPPTLWSDLHRLKYPDKPIPITASATPIAAVNHAAVAVY